MFFKKTSLKDETAPPTYEQSLKKPYFSIFVLTRDSEKAKNSVHMAKRAKRSVVYFNPTQRNCPNFNPLAGEEADAIECIISSYHAGNPDLPVFFLEKGETLLRSSIKVLKRLDRAELVDGRYATFYHLNRFLQNAGGEGRRFVQDLDKIKAESAGEAKDNSQIISWFMDNYFSENSSTYEHTAGVRSAISKIATNEYLKKVLSPEYDMGERNEVDFDDLISNHGVTCLCVDGLRFLDTFPAHMFFSRYQTASARILNTLESGGAHRLYMDDYLQYFLLSHAPVSPL